MSDRDASAAFDVVDWITRNTGRKLSEDQARCARVLCVIDRPYNMQLIGDRWADVEFGAGFIRARLATSLSTFDDSQLTNLVRAAHEHSVRVEIRPAIYTAVDTDAWVMVRDEKGKWVEGDEHPEHEAPCLVVTLHARQPEGEWWQRHPSLAEAFGTIDW